MALSYISKRQQPYLGHKIQHSPIPKKDFHHLLVAILCCIVQGCCTFLHRYIKKRHQNRNSEIPFSMLFDPLLLKKHSASSGLDFLIFQNTLQTKTSLFYSTVQRLLGKSHSAKSPPTSCFRLHNERLDNATPLTPVPALLKSGHIYAIRALNSSTLKQAWARTK